MENLRSEIAYQKIQESHPEKAESDVELKEEMTPKTFLARLSAILTSVETAFHSFDRKGENQETDKQIEKKAKTAKAKLFRETSQYLPTILTAFAHNRVQLDTVNYKKLAAAKKQLTQNGITSEQREAYIPGVSELLERSITPVHYHMRVAMSRFLPNMLFGKKFEKDANLKPEDPSIKYTFTESHIHARSDAWSLYLGLPQKYDTFGISEYRPTRSVENKYYYKLNNFLDGYVQSKDINIRQRVKENPILFMLRDIGSIALDDFEQKYLKISKNERVMPFKTILADTGNQVMGNYTLEAGTDKDGPFVSYYDIWDLNLSSISKIGNLVTKIIGLPLEIYDRIYYDPETFEIIENPSAIEHPDQNSK